MIGSLVSYSRAPWKVGCPLLHVIIEHHVRRGEPTLEKHGMTVALSVEARAVHLDPSAFMFQYETVMR